MTQNHLELYTASGELDTVLGPGVDTVLTLGHFVLNESGSPLSAKQGSRCTSNGVDRILIVNDFLNESRSAGDLLGVGIKGDDNIVVTMLWDRLNKVVARISYTPVMVINHLELDSANGQLDIVLSKGIKTVNQGHVVVGIGLVPSGRAKQGSRCTSNGPSVFFRNINNTFNLEGHVVRVKDKSVLIAWASELIRGIAVVWLLSGVLSIGINDLVTAADGTITVIAVEVIPVFALAISKDKPYWTLDGSHISVGSVTIVGHEIAGVVSPAAKSTTTHNVHFCIGIKANESDQHW